MREREARRDQEEARREALRTEVAKRLEEEAKKRHYDLLAMFTGLINRSSNLLAEPLPAVGQLPPPQSIDAGTSLRAQSPTPASPNPTSED